jgi:hypothetical protein
MRINWKALWISVLAIAWMGALAHAQEFRIETELYSGKEAEPFAQNLTLFANGSVYDFPLVPSGDPEEITVFDYDGGRFIILDTNGRRKTTVDTKQIVKFVSNILTEAKSRDGESPLIYLKFKKEFDESSGLLTLTDKHVAYRVKTMRPEDPEIAAEYKRFADWYARLNAMRPGNLPPFARLELNKALESHGAIPERVELSISPKSRLSTSKVELSSRHVVTWRLLENDRKRIDRVSEYMHDFALLDYDEYVNRALAAEKQARK